MRKKNSKFFTIIFVMFFTNGLHGQTSSVNEFINAGQVDANKLTKAYFQPWGSGFATSLANGWYNTAKPHGFLPIPGFDITFTGTVLMVTYLR